MKNISLKKVMTPFPVHVEATDTLIHAKKIMREHQIRHLPVMKSSHLVGILSERDIHLTSAIVARFADDGDIMVSEAFSENPFTAHIDTPLGEVLREMAERHIGSVIVTKNHKPVGIFTTTDACRCFAEMLGETAKTPPEAA